MFYLYITGDVLTNICGMGSRKCAYTAIAAIFSENLIDGITNETLKTFRKGCNCLPACRTISYDIELSAGPPLPNYELTKISYLYL